MSYGTKYYAKWDSDGGISFILYLNKSDYSGETTELTLAEKGVTIDAKWSDWYKPIINQSVSVDILNRSTNWYDLEDIMDLEEREFQIVIDASIPGGDIVRVFEGFINSDVVQSNYLNMSVLSITGSNFITQLENTTPPIVDEIDRKPLINILGNTLALTGKDSSVRICCSLEPSTYGTIPSNMTLFNRTAIDTEIFWENNTERKDGLKTLEALLTPFDCYLYWWDNKWYVQRYKDMWNDDYVRNYVEYPTTDVCMGYTDAGTEVSIYCPSTALPISVTDVSGADMVFLNGSQTISMIPGLKTLEIKKNQKAYLNLTINDFTNITPAALHPSVTYPDATGPRRWQAYAEDGGATGWRFPGYTYTGLFGDNSIGFLFNDITVFGGGVMGPGRSYQTIGNAIYRFGVPQYYSGGVYQYTDKHRASLSTKFKATITTADEDTSTGQNGTVLNISWKFASPYPGSGGITQWDHRCWYWLRIPPGGRYIAHRQDTNPSYWEYTTSWSDASSYVVVNATDFDPDTAVAEISVKVPIGDVSGWTLGGGDFDIIFGIMGEDIKGITEENWRIESWPLFAYYGDVIISATGTTSPNVIVGEMQNNVLNKKTVNLDIFDIDNLNYKNGVFTNSSFSDRVDVWTDNGLEYYSLAEFLLRDRFQLYNRNRRKISGNIHYSAGFLKPFDLFYDSYDPSTRKYVLVSYSWDTTKDEYNADFWEYDNTTQINFI